MPLSSSSKSLYDRVLKKIDYQKGQNPENVIKKINELPSDSYKLMALRALYHVSTKTEYKPYTTLFEQLQKKKTQK